MKRLNKNQSGFSAVETVLIVIVVVLIGVAGWLVYKNNHKKTESKTATVQTTTPSKTTSPTSTKPQQQYLTVTEWGIKIPLSSAIADAYYVVSTGTQTNGQPNTIWLGLKSLDAKGCNASNGNGGTSPVLGALVKASPTETDPVTGETYTQKLPNGTTVGQYYYGYATHGGLQKGSTCTSDANAATLDAAFKAAAAGIVAN